MRISIRVGDALAPVASVDEMLSRAGGSVRSPAMDKVIMPTAHTILDRIRAGARSPDSVELEFGLKLAGSLGTVFASTQAEGHITVTLTWNRAESGTQQTEKTDG